MELAVAQVFLGPIVKVALSKVMSAAEKQFNFVVGYEEELETFLDTLRMISGVLRDAEEKTATSNHGVQTWLQALRRILEDADALLDEISYEGLHQKAVHRQKLKQVSHLLTSSNPFAVRLVSRKMASKINKLNDALGKLNNRASGLGLQYILANQMVSDHQGSIQQTDSSLGDPSEVIGREGDSEEIVRLLIESSNDQTLGVVSIVGVGGLGKTTLAKLVWENKQIENHFFKKIWVCVSEKFDVTSILVQMLESLTTGSCGSITNQDTIVSKIKDMLQDKNYLLVLDDVWNEEEEKWKSLRNCLLGITKSIRSSKVLVTTRLPRAASMMGSLLGRIEILKDDDCWSIIKHRAFNKSSVPVELEEIGKKIASECRGVPLVANVVGGTLGKNRNEDHWLSIEKDFDACGPLVNNDQVLQVLKLSFDRLPSSALKQCFAFFSTFPKDSVMEKELLVQVWMANGFLQQPQGSHKEMEDVGEEYFMELVSCALLQDVERDFYGRIVSCKMHDLLHDLAKSLSKSETLVVKDKGPSDIHGIRHMNLICAPSMGPTQTMKVIQEVQSLFSKVDIFNDTPVKFKRLLALSFCGADIFKLPSNLGKLKRLRYLDVSYTKIKEIPKSISKLYLLQTFRFMGCIFIEKPIEGIENLFNLKHIQFDNEKLMPAGVSNLSGLQTLSLFVVKHQKRYRIEELGQLNQLKGDLKICNLGLVSNKAEAERAKLFEKAAIRSLNLEFNSYDVDDYLDSLSPHSNLKGGDHDDDDVLEGLRPHSNLKGFTLSGYWGKSCPRWMFESTGNLGESTCLKNLMRLQFSFCHRLESIPSLLPSKLMEMHINHCDGLESIKLLSLNKPGALTISSCRSLSSVAISSLKSLEISNCDKLEFLSLNEAGALTIADCGSLGSVAISSLKSLDISECHKLELLSAEALTMSGCGNLKSVAISSLKSLNFFHCYRLEFLSLNEAGALTIGYCDRLKSVAISSLKSLKIDYCCELEFLSVNEAGALTIANCDSLKSVAISSLKSLEISSCEKLVSVDVGPIAIASLERIRIQDCEKLETLPVISKLPLLQVLCLQRCENLNYIGNSGTSFASTCLVELDLSRCPNLASIPSLKYEVSSLQSLSIGHPQQLDSFPSSACLKSSWIDGWDGLMHLPNLSGFSSLQTFEISGCQQLKNIEGESSIWPSRLRRLSIKSCDVLTSISLDGFSSSSMSLQELSVLRCPSLTTFTNLYGFTSLQRLYIRYCGLRILPDGLESLVHLSELDLSGFSEELEEFPDLSPIQNLNSSLKILTLHGWDKLKHLPHQIQHLTALRELQIRRFNKLEALPDWLRNLSSLRSLKIVSCDSLMYEPFIEAIQSLSNVEILMVADCRLIEETAEWQHMSRFFYQNGCFNVRHVL